MEEVASRNIFKKHAANAITFAGMGLTVWLNALLWSGHPVDRLIFGLIVLIWASDIIDGLVARWCKEVTSFGTGLDQIRDKFFACTLFAFIFTELWRQGTNGIKILIVLTLIGEAYMIFVWTVARINKIPARIHVSSKIKMSCHFTIIALWFLGRLYPDLNPYQTEILCVLLSVGLCFSFKSAWAYTYIWNRWRSNRK